MGLSLSAFAILYVILDINLPIQVLIIFGWAGLIWLIVLFEMRIIYRFAINNGWYRFVFWNKSFISATKYERKFTILYLTRELGKKIDNDTLLLYHDQLVRNLKKQSKDIAKCFDEDANSILRDYTLSNLARAEKLHELYNEYCDQFYLKVCDKRKRSKQKIRNLPWSR